MTIAFKLVIFYCTRTSESEAVWTPAGGIPMEIRTVPMACSSMVKDLFLLKALEAGADAVTVWVCPEGACRHGEGNRRAWKRIQRVQMWLDEIGVDGRRLTLFHLIPEDHESVSAILREIVLGLERMGKNPAAPPESRWEVDGPGQGRPAASPDTAFHTDKKQRRTDT